MCDMYDDRFREDGSRRQRPPRTHAQATWSGAYQEFDKKQLPARGLRPAGETRVQGQQEAGLLPETQVRQR